MRFVFLMRVFLKFFLYKYSDDRNRAIFIVVDLSTFLLLDEFYKFFNFFNEVFKRVLFWSKLISMLNKLVFCYCLFLVFVKNV